MKYTEELFPATPVNNTYLLRGEGIYYEANGEKEQAIISLMYQFRKDHHYTPTLLQNELAKART